MILPEGTLCDDSTICTSLPSLQNISSNALRTAATLHGFPDPTATLIVNGVRLLLPVPVLMVGGDTADDGERWLISIIDDAWLMRVKLERTRIIRMLANEVETLSTHPLWT